jgi:hypothetical protein
MRHPSRRAAGAVLLTVNLAMGVAACGDDDDDAELRRDTEELRQDVEDGAVDLQEDVENGAENLGDEIEEQTDKLDQEGDQPDGP